MKSLVFTNTGSPSSSNYSPMMIDSKHVSPSRKITSNSSSLPKTLTKNQKKKLKYKAKKQALKNGDKNDADNDDDGNSDNDDDDEEQDKMKIDGVASVE